VTSLVNAAAHGTAVTGGKPTSCWVSHRRPATAGEMGQRGHALSARPASSSPRPARPEGSRPSSPAAQVSRRYAMRISAA